MKTGGQCCCRFQAKWLQLRVRVTRRYQMPGTSSTLAAFVKNRATMRHPQNLGRCFNFGWVPVFCCLLHRRIAQEQSSCSYTGIEIVMWCIAYCITSPNRIEMSWMSKGYINYQITLHTRFLKRTNNEWRCTMILILTLYTVKCRKRPRRWVQNWHLRNCTWSQSSEPSMHLHCTSSPITKSLMCFQKPWLGSQHPFSLSESKDNLIQVCDKISLYSNSLRLTSARLKRN